MKKKTVKKTVKKVTPKKTIKRRAAKRQTATVQVIERVEASTPAQDKIMIALHRLLELAQAQLYDMFRIYVQSKIGMNLPATLEEFIAAWSTTLAKHGINDGHLINALDPHQKEYLFESAKRIEAGYKASVKKAKAAKEASFVESAPLADPPKRVVANSAKPSGVQIQDSQATKINVDDFGLDIGGPDVTVTQPAPLAKKEAATEDSVFGDLDILI